MSNFQFLESHWTDLAKLGDLSEKYVYSDPNTSIIKQGMLSEVMVKYMLAYDGIAEPAYDNTHANRIRILKNNDLLPREIDNTLYILRKARNDAAHNAADEGKKALNNLQLMYELCVWYMQTYGDYNYEPTGYVQPVDMTVCLADLEKENAELEERNQQLLIEIEQIQKNGGADSKRRTVAYQKALNVHLSEAQTRELIDEQLRKDIDPNEKGKTLIFAVDDAHADMITQILKDYYTNLGISEEAVMKITGSIENGNPVKIKEAIRRFKNETYPNIVVTVDLLTTGIDVEEIVNLVFMRRIRSRILFEQMLGRATRLCPEIGKTHFEIYDAVGVYNALELVSTMKPVVANPATTFDDLIDGIDSLDTDRARANQIDLIVAKMRRNKSQMSDEYRTQFEQLSGGMTPEEFIEKIHSMPVDKAIETVKNNRAALEYVRRMPKEREKFISDEPDELRSHTRGYGDATRPEDYLKEFRDFIDNNMNEIAALNIVATRPKELTRQSLKELKIILDGKHFNETMLQTAWKEMTNEDIAADIISFIRQRSIGDALISKDDRIHNAIVKTKANHPELSKIQLGWLDRIEAQLLKEVVLNRETFDSDAFKNKGGYNAVNKAFGQKLDEFIDEINGYMYSA